MFSYVFNSVKEINGLRKDINRLLIKPKSPCILLNKNINFNVNETESKMENPTDYFRETNLVRHKNP